MDAHLVGYGSSSDDEGKPKKHNMEGQKVTYPLKGRNFRKHSLSLQNDDDDLYNPECPSGDQSPNFDPLQDTGQEKHEIKEISNQSRSRSNSPQEEQHPRMHSRSPEQRLGVAKSISDSPNCSSEKDLRSNVDEFGREIQLPSKTKDEEQESTSSPGDHRKSRSRSKSRDRNRGSQRNDRKQSRDISRSPKGSCDRSLHHSRDSSPRPSRDRSPVRSRDRSPRRRERSPRRDRSPRKDRSPRHVDRSPRRGDRSPRRGDRSPRRGKRSPRRGSRSPRRGERSPRRGDRSPRRGDRSPRRVDRSPRRGNRSPRRGNRSPRGRDRSPRCGDRSPRRGDRSPKRGGDKSPRRRSPRQSRSPDLVRDRRNSGRVYLGGPAKPIPPAKEKETMSSEEVMKKLAQRQESLKHEAQANAVTHNLPSYLNPSVVNPQLYAKQQEKRKLLWSNKKKEETPTNTAMWSGTKFTGDQGGEMGAKFRRLMGIKGDNQDPGEEGPSKGDQILTDLEKEFERSRAFQLSRGAGGKSGIGLGYAPAGYQQ